jgi:RNA polymerase sigma-70 factor, ECF subfamily
VETSHGNGINKDSDGALVAAAKCGDTQAFEKLVSRHQQRLLAAAQRITNNREDAEDVMQEGFHKAFLHVDEFQEKARFSTWLTRIVMNEAIMLLRRRRRALEVLPEDADNDANPVSRAFVDRKPNPEQSCWQRERTELLTQAIDRLRPKIRRTIVLHDIEECSAKETAQILGTSVSAVKSRVCRGRQELLATVSPGLLREVYAAGPTEAHAAHI